jgi:hypothetical protein
MGNLVRIKQIDKPELSGYIREVGDVNYYPTSNPSGYISSVNQDADFSQLALDVSTLSGDLYSDLAATGATLTYNLGSSGNALNTKIDNLSGYVEVSNVKIATVSGNVDYAQFLATGLDYSSNITLSGNIIATSGYASGTSGSLSSRITSLEGVFAASGSNFVDIYSNNQTVIGQKNFDGKTSFKLINIVPISGDYSNPGGLNNYLYTQFIDNNIFYVSGLGYRTGDFFVTKIMYPNNEECIISSNIYTGNY